MKDITELFTGTGLGKKGYSIIGRRTGTGIKWASSGPTVNTGGSLWHYKISSAKG